MENIKIKQNSRRALLLAVCTILTLALCAGFFMPRVSAASGQGQYRDLELIPGGVPFGVKFSTEGVVVVGFSDLEGISKSQNPIKLNNIFCSPYIFYVSILRYLDHFCLPDDRCTSCPYYCPHSLTHIQ